MGAFVGLMRSPFPECPRAVCRFNFEALLVPGRISRLASIAALALVAIAWALPADVTATTNTPAPPALVEFTGTPSPARSGDTAILTTTVNRDIVNSGYVVVIVDTDSGAALKSCSSGTSCSYGVVIGWQNHAVKHRNFVARVQSTSGVVVSSLPLTLPVERYDFGLTLTGTPNPARSGDTEYVSAAINREIVNSGLVVRIYDADTSAALKTCSAGTVCTYSYPIGWQNHALRNRQFLARVEVSNGGAVQEQATLTLPVERYDFGLSMSSTPDPVVVGTSFVMKATINRDIVNTGLLLRIHDADSGVLLISCYSGTSCSYGIAAPGWATNANPEVKRYTAKLVRASDGALQEATTLTIPVRPYRFSVSVAFANRTVAADGTIRFTATANVSRTVTSTGYAIKIINGAGQVSATCTSGVGCSTTVPAGAIYRAVVQNAAGHLAGESFGSLLTGDGASELQVNGLDLAYLAARFASAHAFCDEVLLAPGGTYTQATGTVKQEYWTCLAAAQAGQSTPQIMAAVAAVGVTGSFVLAWVAQQSARDKSCTQLGTCSPPPQCDPCPPPTGCDPCPPPTGCNPCAPTSVEPVPHPLPPEWRAKDVAARIATRNPNLLRVDGEVATNADVQTITEECLIRASEAGLDGSADCSGLPVFVSGNDVAEAARHDLEALAATPPRPFKLNYLRGGPSGVPRQWYASRPECNPLLDATDCDEYPFFATEQGGPQAEILPHLKRIDSAHNRDQGKYYGFYSGPEYKRNFIKQCGLKSRGDIGPDGILLDHGTAFLALPLDPGLDIPTITTLCNGSNG